MTDELRALLRADLEAQQPPPVGDLVGAAIRAGRRRRRNRRIGAGAALAGAVVLTLVLLADLGIAARPGPLPAAAPAVEVVPAEPALPKPSGSLSPETVPIEPSGPTAPPPTRTLTIHSGTQRAEGMQKKATSAAMLHLLTQLLPPGRTSRYGVVSGNDLLVQLYLDAGAGPQRLRVAVDKTGDATHRDGSVTVTVEQIPGDCAVNTTIDALWSDGTTVRLDLSGCTPALSADQAIAVAADPRWGVTMDAALVGAGAARFADVPELAS